MQWLKRRKFFLFETLLIALGALVGVVSSQYEFFEIDQKLSISDLLIFILSSIVGLYIANNISKSLSRVQTVKTLFQEDIKSFISYTQKLENWINLGVIPAVDLRSHLKTGNLKLRSIQKIYGSTHQINATSLPAVIIKYNSLKSNITNLNTTNNGMSVPLLPAQASQFIQEIEDIKNDLLNSIINC